MAGAITASEPSWTAPFTGLSPRCFGKLVTAVRRETAPALGESEEDQRGVQTGPTADVVQQLLGSLRHSAVLIENAWKRTAVAAANAGVPWEEVARWADTPTETLRSMLAAGRQEDDG